MLHCVCKPVYYYALVHMCRRHIVSWFMYLCICHSVYWLYVCNSDFPMVATNQTLANAVQAQCNNSSDLIALVL